MSGEEFINVLKPGDVFRDWLIDVVGDKVRDKRCKVLVYRYFASHTVCRYEFKGEHYGVFAKFYNEPRGGNRRYDTGRAMDNEFEKLKRIEKLIDIPRPLAKKERFNCALVTEDVQGKPLYRYIHNENGLFDKLTSLAHTLRTLHDGTRSSYKKEREFGNFHKILGQIRLNKSVKERFDRHLGDWWYNERSDWSNGCFIHNDANPANYLFRHGKIFALDFESSQDHAHPVHDLGIVTSELKKYFGWNEQNPAKAEPYIGHFLWHYSRGEKDFNRVTRALPFFMSLGLLRMARWGGSDEQRSYLLREAEACLSSGLNAN